MSVFQEFIDRGMIAQSTDFEAVQKLLDNEKVTFYVGFDPTADSLHIGHFIPLKIMAHMQRAGHRPIALFGGATAKIGDPSGKNEMRKMLTSEQISHNITAFQKQFARFIDTSDGKALFVNNADWFEKMNFIDFIRDIGPHFTINKMLAAECYKSRLDTGLTFLEVNYMPMQSYDFYHLNKEYGCKLEFGGDDQWSNIIGGVELIRRKEQKEAYGLTFKLLLTSEGKKMGKTEKGALWLDPQKTSPYDFYQYWRNIADADVINCMKMLTFMPLDEIAQYAALEGSDINRAKEKLAYEVTELIHGEEEAVKAQDAARALFASGASSADMPTTPIMESELTDGCISVIDALIKAKLVPSKGEARRLIQQNGLFIDDVPVTTFDAVMSSKQLSDGTVVRKGKKTYHRFTLA